MIKKLLFFLFLFPQSHFSQEFIYENFGINEGLPSLQVYDIFQDKNGIMWFATDRGIANYNGYEIKSFGLKDGLTSNVILDLYPQADGRVYCATFNNSLFYFEENFNGFVPYKHNDTLSKYLSHDQNIMGLYIDSKENLHIACELKNGELVISKDGKVLKNHGKDNLIWDEKKYIVYEEKPDNSLFYYISLQESVDKRNQNILPTKSVYKVDLITLPDSHYMILKEDTQISIIDKNTTKVKVIKNDWNPICIHAIDRTHFFIGYSFGGGKIVDIEGNVEETFLKDYSVTRFLIDKNGGYWFTTHNSGVFYIKEPEIRIFNGNKTGIPIQSLAKNNLNELFVTYDNGNILKIDTNYNFSVYFGEGDKSKTLFEYDTFSDETFFYNRELKKNEVLSNSLSGSFYIIKLSEPAEKGLIASQIGKILLIDLKKEIPIQTIEFPFRVQDACYWKDDVFLGSMKGVFLYNTRNKKLVSMEKRNALFGSRADDIDYNEKKNELYFATLGRGLIIYNKNTGTVLSISKKDGLFSDIVGEVYIEKENEIWLCTNSGLNKLTFQNNGKFSITGLKSSNGLIDDGIVDVEIIDNVVWVASKKGLVYLPKELFNSKNYNYPLRIKQILINDKEATPAVLKSLSHKQNRVEFNFETVSLKSGKNLIYNYTLEGLDNKWYSTTNRKVTFPSLPHGEYVFKLQVQNPNGIRDKTILEIPISIAPPFWKTYWFITLSIIFLAGTLYLFFKTRILSYNKDITRELIRLLIKKIKKKDNYFIFKEAGKEIRVKTNTILYAKSSGNYIELVTEKKNYLVRCKIGDFIDATPDPLEYLRIHRSYVIRIDKVETKSKTEVTIQGENIPVSHSYEQETQKLFF